MHRAILTLTPLLLLGLGGCASGGPVFENGEIVPERDPDESWDGDLSDGTVIDINWASSGGFGCWAGTEDVNFDGAHVIYERAQPEDVDAWVRVIPDSSVDVSLYALQAGTSGTELPPELNSAVSCETSADRETDSNPGVSEAIKITGYNPYRLIIGVAGANEAIAGAFTVELWLGE